ncbi:MAG TPA: hypothetical protein VFS43_19805 [Polyangiaceae bacterium]|nr:hypothetical protein [Polyangiaceae bacterium]
MRATNHTCLSPVSGLLGILALWVNDPVDPDVRLAVGRLEGWIWEDDVDGARVAGARSATWDTAFATQALAAAAPHVDVRESLRRAGRFLNSQQIRERLNGAEQHDRLNPVGGYCFAGVWHGWPVSDCTAPFELDRTSPKGAPSKNIVLAGPNGCGPARPDRRNRRGRFAEARVM